MRCPPLRTAERTDFLRLSCWTQLVRPLPVWGFTSNSYGHHATSTIPDAHNPLHHRSPTCDFSAWSLSPCLSSKNTLYIKYHLYTQFFKKKIRKLVSETTLAISNYVWYIAENHFRKPTYLFSTTFSRALPTSFPGTARAMSSTQVTCRAWAAGLGNSLNLQSQFGNGPGDLPAIGGNG